MEDTLRVDFSVSELSGGACLNPCFNGRYSQSTKCSLEDLESVLILVLMEDTLRDTATFDISRVCPVLILVLMEDTLREHWTKVLAGKYLSLNPCFNGRYSQS